MTALRKAAKNPFNFALAVVPVICLVLFALSVWLG